MSGIPPAPAACSPRSGRARRPTPAVEAARHPTVRKSRRLTPRELAFEGASCAVIFSLLSQWTISEQRCPAEHATSISRTPSAWYTEPASERDGRASRIPRTNIQEDKNVFLYPPTLVSMALFTCLLGRASAAAEMPAVLLDDDFAAYRTGLLMDSRRGAHRVPLPARTRHSGATGPSRRSSPMAPSGPGG